MSELAVVAFAQQPQIKKYQELSLINISLAYDTTPDSYLNILWLFHEIDSSIPLDDYQMH